MRRAASNIWAIVKDTFAQWQAHRSAEMASSLAFYGALALAGLALAAVYVASLVAAHPHAGVTGSARHVGGPQNAQALEAILRSATHAHYGWIALAVGALMFVLAVAATAFQLQRALDAVWDRKKGDGSGAVREAGGHALQFLGIYVLALLLMVLLFAGGAVHALTTHTHALPLMRGALYQALDIGASIVLLTFLFLFMFAYLPPVDIPWRGVWIASFVSAVLYERGQFALAFYFGQMNAKSPYADAGALLAVLIWLYYSAQVVLVGAILTKVLKQRADERGAARKNAA